MDLIRKCWHLPPMLSEVKRIWFIFACANWLSTKKGPRALEQHQQVNSHTTCSPAASRHHTYNLSSHNSHTHSLLTYNSTHTTCSHTNQLTHNLLTYHTYNLSSYILLTHNSTHTQLAHTYNLSSHNTHNSTHTQLAHMQLNSHNLSSHNSHTTQLTHNLPYSYISHTHTRIITQLVHTQLVHTQLPHTQLVAHTHLVLPDIHLRDRRGTWRHPPSFHVAGVALGHIHIRFTWQVWHCGTYGTGRALVAHRVLSWRRGRRGSLRGRRGTWSHPHSFHVAGVALTALGGLWWRSGFLADAVDAAALCMAGVALGHIHIRFALGDIHLRFTWQAWHLVTSTFVSRGKRGTYGTVH